MKIKENNFIFGKLDKRSKTDYIILHHRAGNGDAESIHKEHRNKGWAGIGYNLYIRKDGTIESGRPLDVVGAHAVGYNQNSVGVCFEGNFEKEHMTDKQIKAGQEVVAELKRLYAFISIASVPSRLGKSIATTLFPFTALTFAKEET